MGGAQVISLGAGFIRAKVVAIVFGASGIGLIGVLNAFNGNISSFVGWGLATSGVRVIAGATEAERPAKISAVQHLGTGFMPLRKLGKLPGPVESVNYQLEYGDACLQAQRNTLAPGSRVLIVDDVLATGGTLVAASELVARLGVEVVGLAVIMELVALRGRPRLSAHRLHSVMTA